MKRQQMDIEGHVERYLAFWNQADIDGLMSMYDEGMLYHDMPSGEVIPYGDLKNFLRNTFGFETAQTLKLKDAVYLDEKSAFIYWEQSIASGGQDNIAHINGVELIVFNSEKIVSIHEYYDYQGDKHDSLVIPGKDANFEQMTKLGLTDDLMTKIGQEIISYFDDQSPYLDPELNLNKVSEHLGRTRNQISYVINHVLDQTFYDLINTRRIKHVIEQMSSATIHRSILEMAINAGFNSMSGFYNAFKKHTGMSPVKFQKTNLTQTD